MPVTTSAASRPTERRALLAGATVFLLTSVHHVYGAVIYHTPWRYHAVIVAAAALLAMLGALAISRRRPDTASGRAAWWVFWGVNAAVAVLVIGAFEGAYNHVLKVALYLAGLPRSWMHVLYPPPTYELPNDAVFEITGVAQVIPAAASARYLLQLAVGRLRRSRGAATKLSPGAELAARELTSISGEPVRIPDPTRLVHLQLRRFAGCPVCDLHLRSVVRRHEEIEAAGIREVVVFHSTAEDLRRYEDDLPFAVIADPDKHLYMELGVESSAPALLDPRVWVTVVRAVAVSLWRIVRDHRPVPSLDPEGGRFGLPADFLIDRDGRVLAVKYGVHAGDQWSVDELLAVAHADALLRPGPAAGEVATGAPVDAGRVC